MCYNKSNKEFLHADHSDKLIKYGVNIENELQELVTKSLLSKEEIVKTVENSQRIEGYEPVSQEYELEIEAFMKKNNNIDLNMSKGNTYLFSSIST